MQVRSQNWGHVGAGSGKQLECQGGQEPPTSPSRRSVLSQHPCMPAHPPLASAVRNAGRGQESSWETAPWHEGSPRKTTPCRSRPGPPGRGAERLSALACPPTCPSFPKEHATTQVKAAATPGRHGPWGAQTLGGGTLFRPPWAPGQGATPAGTRGDGQGLQTT